MLLRSISYGVLGGLFVSAAVQASEHHGAHHHGAHHQAAGHVVQAHGGGEHCLNKRPCDFSGFYAGLNAGYAFDPVTIQRPRGGNLEREFDTEVQGFAGGLFVGYGKELGHDRVYLGLETSGLFSNAKGKAGEKGALLMEAKRPFRWDIAARLGVAVNNALLYAKVGYGLSKSKLELEYDDPNSPGTLVKEKYHNTLGVLVAGAGVDVKLSQKAFVGLSYTAALYKKKYEGKHKHKISFKPAAHNVLVRVGFLF